MPRPLNMLLAKKNRLGFDRQLFELYVQASDKDCEWEFEMLCQETTHMAPTTFVWQITSTE